MKIGKELALIAKKKGICQEWFDQMKTQLDDKDRLLEMLCSVELTFVFQMISLRMTISVINFVRQNGRIRGAP